MPGMFCAANFGFLTTLNDLLGTMFVIMYGPLLGGRSVVSVWSGVPHGTSPSSGNASTLVKAPYGFTRWIVIWPVVSSVVTPVMWSALPVSKSVAPTTLSVKKLLPPQLTLIMRSAVQAKSLALIGVPSEKTRFLRRVSV